jgi:hypothetical protein
MLVSYKPDKHYFNHQLSLKVYKILTSFINHVEIKILIGKIPI